MERLEAGVVTREFRTIISVFSLRRIVDEERGKERKGEVGGREPLSGYARIPKGLRMYPTRNWFALVPSRGARCFMQIAR